MSLVEMGRQLSSTGTMPYRIIGHCICTCQTAFLAMVAFCAKAIVGTMVEHGARAEKRVGSQGKYSLASLFILYITYGSSQNSELAQILQQFVLGNNFKWR